MAVGRLAWRKRRPPEPFDGKIQGAGGAVQDPDFSELRRADLIGVASQPGGRRTERGPFRVCKDFGVERPVGLAPGVARVKLKT